MSSQDGRKRQAGIVAAALRAHRRELAAFVRARVPASDVDDVLQVAAVRAIERAGSLKDPARVLPWLYRVHRNAATDESRKRARHERWLQVDSGRVPAADIAVSEGESSCRCGLAQIRSIRPSYASVLTMVDVEGATLAEAAKALGISANNVAVRLHRARKVLRRSMQEHCGVTSLRECADCRCVYDGCCAA